METKHKSRFSEIMSGSATNSNTVIQTLEKNNESNVQHDPEIYNGRNTNPDRSEASLKSKKTNKKNREFIGWGGNLFSFYFGDSKRITITEYLFVYLLIESILTLSLRSAGSTLLTLFIPIFIWPIFFFPIMRARCRDYNKSGNIQAILIIVVTIVIHIIVSFFASISSDFWGSWFFYVIPLVFMLGLLEKGTPTANKYGERPRTNEVIGSILLLVLIIIIICVTIYM